ncbi:HD domain-containing protein [Psychrobacillus sp. NEAU-3TGS]|uniref:HD domain-containing protein n=1 Tax=Psychrobacillus sp. NEAU-3TGS TaxID=2995412 RepID=UPI0024970355|nr:HD domain-containing protein [Psychrobacillus sp. NEAU-3TGS]MDI2589164.1 HD domain-containing protein [Psychrobacillus sp. NEAU-3TGS]
MRENLIDILKVIKLGEKLKYELRHSWLSTGRQESVAEHTWRVSLMAMLIEPYLDKKVDIAKLLKMIIIHDLVEAEARDIPAFETMNNMEKKKEKEMNEMRAIENIKDTLKGKLGEDIYNLWIEFENKQSFEAKVANALDKLEAQIQHNEADISTWIDVEYQMSFMLGKHTDFNTVLTQFKDIIEEEAEIKIENEGIVEVENVKLNLVKQ